MAMVRHPQEGAENLILPEADGVAEEALDPELADLKAENARLMAQLEAPFENLDALVAAVERLGQLVAQKQAGGGAVVPIVPRIRNFSTSEFKRLYDLQAPVTQQYELFSYLHLFLKSYAAHKGLPESAADEMFAELQQQAFASSPIQSLLSEIEKIAVVLWTSTCQTGLQKEFCSILNEILRDDCLQVLPHAVVLCRAMASLVVVRRKDAATLRWPDDLLSHRGTSMPRDKVDFFTVGLLYRAPMFLATSFLESKANDFLRTAPAHNTPVHFKFRLDPVKKCDHAIYIEHMTLVAGEHELLYAPYSAFRVLQVVIPDTITWDNPVVIEVSVLPNNKTAPEEAPLAKWH